MRIAPLLLLSALAGARPAHADAISYGQVVASTLGASEQDIYTFTAPADARVLVRLTSVAGEPSVAFNVVQVGGSSIGQGGGTGPAITLTGATVSAGQSYEIRIPGNSPTGAGYAGQSYRLILQNLTAPVGATAIALGDAPVAGSIDQPGDMDFYTIDAHAGDTVLFTATRTSGAIDPEAVQFIPQLVGTCTPNYDGEPDHPTVLTQCENFAADGTFTFWVDDYDDAIGSGPGDDDTGGYTIAAACFAGPCLSATTTTTTSAGSTSTGATTSTVAGTTTTTLAPTIVLPIDGKKLLFKTPPNKPNKKLLTVLSTDADLGLGGGNGSADDPRTAGATLRIRSVAGGFDATYPLAASRWKLIGANGANKGYRYTDPSLADGPVAMVVVKKKHLGVTVKGAQLAATLASNPNPIDVVFTMGTAQSCASLGGATTFTANKKFAAKNASAPGSCP